MVVGDGGVSPLVFVELRWREEVMNFGDFGDCSSSCSRLSASSPLGSCSC